MTWSHHLLELIFIPDYSGRQPLPCHLSTIPYPHLSTMSLPCCIIDNLDHSPNALFNFKSSLLKSKKFSAVVASVCLNPAIVLTMSNSLCCDLTEFQDLPRINRKRGQLRLFEMDCLGKEVEDNLRWCIRSVLHRKHIPIRKSVHAENFLSQNGRRSLDHMVSKQ